MVKTEAKRLNYKNLKFKIGLVISLVISLILVLQTFLNIHRSRRAMEGDIRVRAIEAINELMDDFDQTDVVKPSVALDLSISKLMREQMWLTKIEVYSVSDQRTELVTSTEKYDVPIDPTFFDSALKEKKVRTFSMVHGDERFFVIMSPVMGGENIIGLVSVLGSLNEVDENAKRQFKIFLLTTCATIILLTLVLYIYLNRIISNPLKQIVSAMEKVKAGDLRIKAVVNSEDEIGELAKNFNSMVSKIKEEDERIENFNKELQIKIEEATKRLSERNAELVHLNEDLFELQNEMSRLETLASLGQLAASVAHEVGTPLHSISGHVQLLFEKGGLPNDALERLKIVQAQIDRLTEIINKILSSTRLPDPDFQQVDVNAVITDIINLAQPGLRKKNVEIGTQLDENLPLVLADQNQLQQVLINLLSNAVEAMPEGGAIKILTGLENGPRILPSSTRFGASHATQVPEAANDFVTIKVQDTGIGISTQDIKNIFKPFFSTKRERKATGLGLSITKKIIKDHRGEIDVISNPGQGTTFIIRLPSFDPRQVPTLAK